MAGVTEMVYGKANGCAVLREDTALVLWVISRRKADMKNYWGLPELNVEEWGRVISCL